MIRSLRRRSCKSEFDCMDTMCDDGLMLDLQVLVGDWVVPCLPTCHGWKQGVSSLCAYDL